MKTITIPRFVLYTLVIALVAMTVIFMFAMKDGNACIGNPFVYGVEKATTDDTGRVTCSCDFSAPGYSKLYFDIDGMSTEDPLVSLLG